MSVLEFVELVEELPNVLKVPVDAGETHVCDRVQASELVQDVLSKSPRKNLLISGVDEPPLHLVQETLECFGRHGSLYASAPEASKQLGPVVGLSPAVVLDDQR
jgi:hypothetical protein